MMEATSDIGPTILRYHTWNPKSKNEPYAQSAVEIVKQAKETVQDFFEIPVGITDDLVKELAQGLELLFQDFTTFVSSCGSKQSYIPTLPPLTRCNRDSKLLKLLKKAAPCSTSINQEHNRHHDATTTPTEAQQTRSLTSRGTQRLYIRLNTLHYIKTELHALENTLSSSPTRATTTSRRHHHASLFETCHAAIDSSCLAVSEIAAHRLVFLDSAPVLHETLYTTSSTRLSKPSLKTLSNNLALLTAMVTDRAQSTAMREVMRACFESFLMALLAGGPSRSFQRSDHEAVDEDLQLTDHDHLYLQALKRVFYSCGEGLVSEDYVDREAEAAEGVLALMGQSTEQLTEDLLAVIEAGTSGSNKKLPTPPTTGRWSRTDSNTILRVLCYRDENEANLFLKKTFHLAKRR